MGKKSGLKQAVFTLAEKSGGLRLIQSLGPGNGSQVYVLAYHRVDTHGHRPWLNPELVSATAVQFSQQMELLSWNYQPVGIGDLLAAAQGTRPLPRQAVLVTVDDGYLDFKETVLPVCAAFGIRPLLFVPTGYVGQGVFWWDQLYQLIYLSGWEHIRLAGQEPIRIVSLEEKQAALLRLSRAIKSSSMESGVEGLDGLYQSFLDEVSPGEKERYTHNTLDWDDLRQLSRLGADLAPHTHSHPILTRVSPEKMQQEIRQSWSTLRAEVGECAPVFAYPDGVAAAFSPQAARAVQAEGIRLAFTMLDGRADLNRVPHLALPRLGTWSRLSLAHFHFRLTPLLSWFKSASRSRDHLEA